MWTTNLHKLFQNAFVKPYDGDRNTRPYESRGIKDYRGQSENKPLHYGNSVVMVDGVPTCANGVPVRTITGGYTNALACIHDIDSAPLFSSIMAPVQSYDVPYRTSIDNTALSIIFGSDGTPASYEDEMLGHWETDITIVKVGATITANGSTLVDAVSWYGYEGTGVYTVPDTALTWKDAVAGSVVVWIKNSSNAPVTLREMGIVQTAGAFSTADLVLVGRFLIPAVTIQPDEIAEVSFTVC